MTAYWGSNTATQEILIIGAPPAFFPISCCQATGEPDPRHSVCVCACVCGISGRATGGGADQGVYRRTLGLFY